MFAQFLIELGGVPTMPSLTRLCPIMMKFPPTLPFEFLAFPKSDSSSFLSPVETCLGIRKVISLENTTGTQGQIRFIAQIILMAAASPSATFYCVICDGGRDIQKNAVAVRSFYFHGI